MGNSESSGHTAATGHPGRGFAVDDGRTRRLEQQARRLGFDTLRSYIQSRCDAGMI
jgi:hypothetical protein